MKQTQDEPPVPLEYASQRERRGWKFWLSRFLTRLSEPMPLAMYYLITAVLMVIATILALLIRIIVKAFG